MQTDAINRSNCLKMLHLILFVLGFASQPASAQETLVMTIGRDAQAFHFGYEGLRIATTEPDALSLERCNEAIDLLGQLTTDAFERPEFREAPALNNAVALVREGRRYVVLGSGYLRNLAPGLIDKNSGELLLYGHEVGHHLCGHTTGARQDDPWRKELEADQIAGALAYALNMQYTEHVIVTLESLLNAAARMFARQGTSTHPDLGRRQAAIQQGWHEGPACLSNWSVR